MAEVLPLPDRRTVGVAVAERLVAAQFPQWAGLEVRAVDAQGWDNCTFRLGDEMLVRLPTAEEYALAVDKEHRWLPVFAPALPLEIPVPLARGVPDEDFPHDWSVYRWLGGEPADACGRRGSDGVRRRRCGVSRVPAAGRPGGRTRAGAAQLVPGRTVVDVRRMGPRHPGDLGRPDPDRRPPRRSGTGRCDTRGTAGRSGSTEILPRETFW